MSLIESLINLRYGISKDTVLNPDRGGMPPGGSADPDRLGEVLLGLRSQAAVSVEDDLDYGELARSEAYANYRRHLLELRSFDPSMLADRERQLAFWINLYNGLVLDAVIQWRIMRSVLELPGFFWRAAYNIGGLRYSANDIENGIVRGNAPHPAIPGAPFGRADPRRAFSMMPTDPRVHFALVCASRSCPPVAVYDAERVNEQLDQATRSFIRGGGVKVDGARRRVLLSRIFQWYAVDFGAHWFAIGDRGPLLRFAAPYLESDDALRLTTGGIWSVSFTRYDWSLNGLWSAKEP